MKHHQLLDLAGPPQKARKRTDTDVMRLIGFEMHEKHISTTIVGDGTERSKGAIFGPS